MPDFDLRGALDARNRADRRDVRFQLLLALPVSLLGIGFANVMGLIFWGALHALGLRIGGWTFLLAFNVALAIAIVIDLKRHPQETWFVPRYYQSDGSVKGNEFGPGETEPLLDLLYMELKGSRLGMPLMTNVSDPHNLAQGGRAISSGFANLILGGPRAMARALAHHRRIGRRSKAVRSAEAFVDWLAPRGPLPEEDVKEHLRAHPEQVSGFALAREIDVIARFRNPVDFHYRVR